MLEIEMKFPLADESRLIFQLREEFGAMFGPEIIESDLYFQSQTRDFRRTDEALRIRRTGNKAVLTYKGPKLDTKTKTREEIELPILFSKDADTRGKTGDSDELAEKIVEKRLAEWKLLLRRLGFEPFAPVVKARRTARLIFDHADFTITLDRLERLGSFAEIETLAADSERYAEARDALLKLAEKLDLGPSIRTSYLGLLLNSRENA